MYVDLDEPLLLPGERDGLMGWEEGSCGDGKRRVSGTVLPVIATDD
jgi:hypothetical protein